MQIIKFEPKYRDDLIFMILEAKNALGRIPGLNEDLLDIQKNYFDKGDMFWVALDENDRVIACTIGHFLGYAIPTAKLCFIRRPHHTVRTA